MKQKLVKLLLCSLVVSCLCGCGATSDNKPSTDKETKVESVEDNKKDKDSKEDNNETDEESTEVSKVDKDNDKDKEEEKVTAKLTEEELVAIVTAEYENETPYDFVGLYTNADLSAEHTYMATGHTDKFIYVSMVDMGYPEFIVDRSSNYLYFNIEGKWYVDKKVINEYPERIDDIEMMAQTAPFELSDFGADPSVFADIKSKITEEKVGDEDCYALTYTIQENTFTYYINIKTEEFVGIKIVSDEAYDLGISEMVIIFRRGEDCIKLPAAAKNAVDGDFEEMMEQYSWDDDDWDDSDWDDDEDDSEDLNLGNGSNSSMTMLNTDYDKVFWGAEYTMSDLEGVRVSVTLSTADPTMLIVAMTNLYDKPISVSANAVAKNAAGDEIGDVSIYESCIGTGCTIFRQVYCDDIPDGRLSWSDVEVAATKYKSYEYWEGDWSVSKDGNLYTINYSIDNLGKKDAMPGDVKFLVLDDQGFVVGVATDYISDYVGVGKRHEDETTFYLKDGKIADIAMFCSPTSSN